MGWSPLQFDMRILLCSPHNALNSNAQSLGHVLDRVVIAKNLMPEFKSGLSPKRESCRQTEKQIRCWVIFPFLFVVVAALLQRSDQMLQCSIDHVFQCIVCCAGLGVAALQDLKTTPVGFEPTRGDPIGLAGRRLNRSAKVSLVCSALKSIRLALPGDRMRQKWKTHLGLLLLLLLLLLLVLSRRCCCCCHTFSKYWCMHGLSPRKRPDVAVNKKKALASSNPLRFILLLTMQSEAIGICIHHWLLGLVV